VAVTAPGIGTEGQAPAPDIAVLIAKLDTGDGNVAQAGLGRTREPWRNLLA
jgi:hypothetical protein